MVAPLTVVPVSSGTVWEGRAGHCHCPACKGNLDETSKWTEVRGGYKARLAPLQTWGQRGFSKPPDPTHRRPLAHTLRVASHCLSLMFSEVVISPFPCFRNRPYTKVRAAPEELLKDPTTLKIHSEAPSEIIGIPEPCAL